MIHEQHRGNGCGSKICTQHGILVNGPTPAVPWWFMLTHAPKNLDTSISVASLTNPNSAVTRTPFEIITISCHCPAWQLHSKKAMKQIQPTTYIYIYVYTLLVEAHHSAAIPNFELIDSNRNSSCMHIQSQPTRKTSRVTANGTLRFLCGEAKGPTKPTGRLRRSQLGAWEQNRSRASGPASETLPCHRCAMCAIKGLHC